MIRVILRFFGFFFSAATIGLALGAVAVAAVIYMYSRDLPDYEVLANYEPATLSRVYSGGGALMDEFAKERRIFTPVDEIPDVVKHAFISAEDKNFYNHQGFDLRGIAAAGYEFVSDRVRGGSARARGASTIPQQVAKNFLLSGERSAERKIKEIILSTRMISSLGRDKVLELYLNEIFLGLNSYGVTEAAGKYYGKTLEELTPGEAAYLAALAQRPSTLHPIRYRDDAVARRNYVLREMTENGFINREVAEAETAQPLLTVQTGDYASLQSRLPARDYFTDEIRRQLSRSLGDDALFEGGLSIRATMDPGLQNAAAEALREGLEAYDRNQGIWRGPVARIDPALLETEESWRAELSNAEIPRDVREWVPAVVLLVGENAARVGIENVEDDEDGHFIPMADMAWRPLNENGRPGRQARRPSDLLAVGDVVFVKPIIEDGVFARWSLRQIPEVQGAFMAMDTRNGRVLAMQGGFSYQNSVFNRATQATRQPGSAFKPFVYAAALDSGYTPATVVVDAPIEVETAQGIWRPQNASKQFYGPAPLRTGIERSRNLMTVRIAQDVGMQTVGWYAERFGVYDNMPEILSYALGAGETTLFKMVAAYAQFANGGLNVEPTLVDRVQNRFGETIFRHDSRYCENCGAADQAVALPVVVSTARRVMDQVTAYQLTSMMQGVVSHGTARTSVGQLGVPIAGKTGTTNEAKDVWFVGFTPEIAAGCYIGYDTPRPLGKKASGGAICGPVFAKFMETALQGHGPYRFPQPSGTKFVKIDRYSGARVEDNVSGPEVVAELFRLGEEPDFGYYGAFIDGGFAMGSDLLLYDRGTSTTVTVIDNQGNQVEREVLAKPTFGSISSGGLY